VLKLLRRDWRGEEGNEERRKQKRNVDDIERKGNECCCLFWKEWIDSLADVTL
jgi:hypothetical protein